MNDDRGARLEDKIDSISMRIGSIDATLAAQHVSLKEHMRRTAILEDKVSPLERFVHMTAGAVKFMVLLGLFAGIIEGFSVFFEYIGKR